MSICPRGYLPYIWIYPTTGYPINCISNILIVRAKCTLNPYFPSNRSPYKRSLLYSPPFSSCTILILLQGACVRRRSTSGWSRRWRRRGWRTWGTTARSRSTSPWARCRHLTGQPQEASVSRSATTCHTIFAMPNANVEPCHLWLKTNPSSWTRYLENFYSSYHEQTYSNDILLALCMALQCEVINPTCCLSDRHLHKFMSAIVQCLLSFHIRLSVFGYSSWNPRLNQV